MSEPNEIRNALDNPQPAPSMGAPGREPPEPGAREAGQFDAYAEFPPDCPIKVLGINTGTGGKQTCYYLNYNGQLTDLEAGNRHGKLALAALFGPHVGWLQAHWPQWSKPKMQRVPGTSEWEVEEPSRIVGLDQAKAAEALVVECTRRGIFDAAGRLRGRGAHRIGERGLLVHCGDKLLASEHRADGAVKGWRWHDPGLYERLVFQAAEPVPRPWHEPVDDRAAEPLLALLQTWNWKRGRLDARFLLGMIAASLIGGGLRWRPHMWITGGRGTGKSTLNGDDGIVRKIFGNGHFGTDNTSAAGIRSSLLNSTIPVMLDEIEAGADNRRVTEVIELMRVASSGGKVTRGSQDHSAVEFTLKSCFWFSSINIPPLQPQDRSRLAILELDPFAADAVPPDFSRFNFAEIGRKLLRRMIDGWDRLEPTKLKFHQALADVGHDQRACDQFGILLACADVALNDWKTKDGLPDDEELLAWALLCRPQRMAEITETTPDHQACVNHLISSTVQARGGDEREQVGTWIGRAVNIAMGPLLAATQDGMGQDDFDRWQKRLEQLGLKLVNARYLPERQGGKGNLLPASWGAKSFDINEPGFLAIAREHQALAPLFDRTAWQGGVWYQALQRNPGAIGAVKVKFGPMKSLTAVLVPLAMVLEDDELPNASKPEAAAAWMAEQERGA